MQLYTLVFFAVFSSFFWASFPCAAQQADAQAQEAPKLPQGDFSDLRRTGQAEVIEVINPLTVILTDGRIARLAGIDIPDYTAEGGGEFSVTARDILRDMLVGQRVDVYQTRDKDNGRVNRMGHHIVHLERHSDNAWAQGALVSLGLARVKTTKRNAEMGAQMLALEARARAEKIGIWREGDYKVLSPEETEERIGEFAIVDGVIRSVTLKENRIYMNFGGNWRDDFTVSIAPEDKRDFSRAQLNPMSWGGTRVRVRGVLKSINGPYIEIDHPAQIEFPDEEKHEATTDEETEAQTDKPAVRIQKVEKTPLDPVAKRRSNP